ncbi:hypothetical protein [Tissierella sp. Yu-01]|uniref:hypothetical protein n=1 Tax=Tissierella sp. Yu-01 TaxID=3035694 RepID=UPI00240DC025|nr:hypothetical protein [Tissierella sp. Yu-01]WFA08447.1 hypothetical protein P3962_12040 [Tissierella sp. Yu-01]
MKIKPSIVLADLGEYLSLYGITLSEEARKTLNDVEVFAYKCDNPSNYNLFFSKVIRNSEIIRNIFKNYGKNPDLAALILEKDYYDCIDEVSNYDREAYSYSKVYMRSRNEKTSIIDTALEYCVKDNRAILSNIDILLASMDDYERILEEDDSHWVDKRLNKSHTTLSHVCGHYHGNLEIKFDDIRKDLLNIKKNNIDVKVA